ncbi:hypothetical protein ACFQ1S_01615 [Kibdelosporangium lantanae]|uniref:RiboL-PSP-HEPN domain-containing protein n=1 Tax=Kibdelosporangium lantanae TaxID=1497396 RepID=A0ABW3M341_9PSEU
MPRKKSGKTAARKFGETIERIEQFTDELHELSLSKQALTWGYEAALLKTYVAFERLMLDCIVAAVNNDTGTISARTGIAFPKHLTDEVCEYLVTSGGYFDFKGRAGLIKVVRGYVPDGHWLLNAVKKTHYKDQLDILVALRNFAAHESPASKRTAIAAVGQQQIGSAGSWVKRQGRFRTMTKSLIKLADEIETGAPY